jgi:hypothetical protein
MSLQLADESQHNAAEVQQEHEQVTIQGRKATIRSKNAKAARLVGRLEDCDEVREREIEEEQKVKKDTPRLTLSGACASSEHREPFVPSC